MSDYLFPNPNLDVCFNCKHYRHATAIGQGLKCTHPANRRSDKLMLIPSRYHTCGHFIRSEKRICNYSFDLSEKSLKKIIRAIDALELEVRLRDEEPDPPTVSFNFGPLGRSVCVSMGRNQQSILVESPKT